MILIGLGANLPTRRFGPPEKTLPAVMDHLENEGMHVTARSRLYKSAPVPASDDPWFVNAVVAVETLLSPTAVMAKLVGTEVKFGRRRSVPNAPRTIDLDLLDYNGKVLDKPAGRNGVALSLPHPRMTGRAFVLLPIADIAPDWCHPVTGRSVAELIEALGPLADIEPLTD